MEKIQKKMLNINTKYKAANVKIKDAQDRLQKTKEKTEKKIAQDALEAANNEKQEFLNQLKYLTKENITTDRISPTRFFQIEYLIQYKGNTSMKIFDINLIGDFQNVSLDYQKTDLYGVREDCNCLKLGIVNDTSNGFEVPTGGTEQTLSKSPMPNLLPIS